MANKLDGLIGGKSLYQTRNVKGNKDNKILLKGRMIHRPENQYHYLLEKNNDPNESVISSETDENL